MSSLQSGYNVESPTAHDSRRSSVIHDSDGNLVSRRVVIEGKKRARIEADDEIQEVPPPRKRVISRNDVQQLRDRLVATIEEADMLAERLSDEPNDCSLTKSDATALTAIRDQLECPICLDTFRRPYLLSPCGHTFCYSCLCDVFKRVIPGNSPTLDFTHSDKKCPTCACLVRHTPTENYLIKSIVSASGKGDSRNPPVGAEPWQGIFLLEHEVGHPGGVPRRPSSNGAQFLQYSDIGRANDNRLPGPPMQRRVPNHPILLHQPAGAFPPPLGAHNIFGVPVPADMPRLMQQNPRVARDLMREIMMRAESGRNQEHRQQQRVYHQGAASVVQDAGARQEQLMAQLTAHQMAYMNRNRPMQMAMNQSSFSAASQIVQSQQPDPSWPASLAGYRLPSSPITRPSAAPPTANVQRYSVPHLRINPRHQGNSQITSPSDPSPTSAASASSYVHQRYLADHMVAGPSQLQNPLLQHCAQPTMESTAGGGVGDYPAIAVQNVIVPAEGDAADVEFEYVADFGRRFAELIADTPVASSTPSSSS